MISINDDKLNQIRMIKKEMSRSLRYQKILLGVLFLIMMALCLGSCSPKKGSIPDENIVYESSFFIVYKIKVDSSWYVIARSTNGVAITKHQ